MVDSRAFRFVVRVFHLFPGVVLLIALGVGVVRACQFLQSPDHVVKISAAVSGGRQ